MIDKNGIEMACSNCQYRSKRGCSKCNFGVGFVASRNALERLISKLYDNIDNLEKQLKEYENERKKNEQGR